MTHTPDIASLERAHDVGLCTGEKSIEVAFDSDVLSTPQEALTFMTAINTGMILRLMDAQIGAETKTAADRRILFINLWRALSDQLRLTLDELTQPAPHPDQVN